MKVPDLSHVSAAAKWRSWPLERQGMERKEQDSSSQTERSKYLRSTALSLPGPREHVANVTIFLYMWDRLRSYIAKVDGRNVVRERGKESVCYETATGRLSEPRELQSYRLEYWSRYV
jgi:hypothetical protein